MEQVLVNQSRVQLISDLENAKKYPIVKLPSKVIISQVISTLFKFN